MTDPQQIFHATLAKLVRLAQEITGEVSRLYAAQTAQNGSGQTPPPPPEPTSGDPVTLCTPQTLPAGTLEQAAQLAAAINPMNAPMTGPLSAMMGLGDVLTPARIAALTSKYWGPTPRRLSVSFMETTDVELRRRILAHMNAWAVTSGVSFVYTAGTGKVRITRGNDGYWSYLGTDILMIPRSGATMCLQGFTARTSESEYRRVVRHETGHTLGFPHEHMRADLVARIDPAKAYAYFSRTQGWDRRTVDFQVLKALDERSILSTPPDQTSIMCYQLPGSITKDGKPIIGGRDLNASDLAFAGKIYPKVAPIAPSADLDDDDDDGLAVSAAAQQAADESDLTELVNKVNQGA